jgi:hypothetical protein
LLAANVHRDIGTSMMLVQTGEVRFSYPGGRAVDLGELKAGTVFGESGTCSAARRRIA